MRILPVLDLKQGVVVRGVAGRRSEYRPIVSSLVSGAAPRDVAAALADTFALTNFYLADLDAIAGAEPAWDVYDSLLNDGHRLWVDAGVQSRQRAEQLAQFGGGTIPLDAVVVGLESLPAADLLDECLEVCGGRRLVFSLDLKSGQPLAGTGWNGSSALEIAAEVVRRGVQRMIVLDLAQVGMDGGVGTLDLCGELHQRHPEVKIIAGGGVRGLDDLRHVAAAGCRGVLTASALHDGRLTRADLTDGARL